MQGVATFPAHTKNNDLAWSSQRANAGKVADADPLGIITMMAATQPTAEGIGGAERARPALLDVKETAALLNTSQRTIYRLADAGKMPRPVKLGALVRWRRDELRQWIDAGCPRVRTAKGGGQ